MDQPKISDQFSKPSFRILSLSIIFILTLLGISCDRDGSTASYEAIPAPVIFSPKIPVDVDPKYQDSLKNKGMIYQLNQAFNEYSWQALIAINWPFDDAGDPMPNFTDSGTPAWLGWKEAFQVFRKDGREPKPWDSLRSDSGLKIQVDVLNDSDSRIIFLSKTATVSANPNIADEVDQAFAGKLFDQNGRVVVYEVLMNKEEFDYVVANKLYNINGQLEFSKNNDAANFPKGDYKTGQLGATEIKFAWKILDSSDIKERYFRDEGYIIINEDPLELEKRELGMIGFHISQKTPTGKQWVWSTFEHIDNLDQNTIEVDGELKIIHPTLTNPDCEICPVNVDVSAKDKNNNPNTYRYHQGKHGNYWTVTNDTVKNCDCSKAKKPQLNKYYASSNLMKTQSKRMVDIPVRVKEINEVMQVYFKQHNSVWQYYQLIDTQYSLDQSAAPGISTKDDYIIPESVTNKSGGDPNLAMLTNITMETFFQDGNQIAGGLMENSDSDMTIFGTESCIGCHSSAYIYKTYNKKDGLIQGPQLSGDFSWLLKTAKWDRKVEESGNDGD